MLTPAEIRLFLEALKGIENAIHFLALIEIGYLLAWVFGRWS